MAFTGEPGIAASMPSKTVPMYGAGGTKRAKVLPSAQVTSTGSIATSHTFVFTQVSITAYRAVSRVKDFITVFRTST
jgi:hypothetical protein